jgi:hypothetical protein
MVAVFPPEAPPAKRMAATMQLLNEKDSHAAIFL